MAPNFALLVDNHVDVYTHVRVYVHALTCGMCICMPHASMLECMRACICAMYVCTYVSVQ